MSEHDRPWRDKELFREKYIGEGKSTYQIAEEWGCGKSTAHRWLKEHGIEARDSVEASKDRRCVDYAYFYTRQGDESWGVRGSTVLVHRLLAVAEYGFDEVKGKVVHHKNRIGWDNRPDNIELLTPSEHAKLHYEQTNRGEGGEFESW